MLTFFKPGENKTSEILAFFLNPHEKHGQKCAFLKTFLEHFNLADNITSLLSANERVTVTCEDSTKDNRRIDITVFFEKANFAIGIEHKIYAPDQVKQVMDYSEDLKRRTENNYKLFYLSPDGHEPSKESIPEKDREALSEMGKFRSIGYRDIVELLIKYESVCRADSVREFIRQLQQYIKHEFLGESFMGENKYVEDYIRTHPQILKHTDALRNATESLKLECFNAFWGKVADNLKSKSESIIINPKALTFCYSGSSSTQVEHNGSPFEPSGELKKVMIYYEPRIRTTPVYITINLCVERTKWSQQLKSKVERLEDNLQKNGFEQIEGYAGHWWCASVALPHIRINDGDELHRILEEKNGGIIQTRAAKAAEIISKYLEVTESLWREIQSPSSLATGSQIPPATD